MVVAASDLGDRVERHIKQARKVTTKQLKADEKVVERDIEEATSASGQTQQQQVMAESEAAVREAEAEAAEAERAAEQYSTTGPRPATTW